MELLKGIAEHGPIHIYPFHTESSGLKIASRGSIYRAKKYLERKEFIILKETEDYRTGKDKKIYHLSDPIQQIYDYMHDPNKFLKYMKMMMQLYEFGETSEQFTPEERKEILKREPPPIIKNSPILRELKNLLNAIIP